MAAAEKKEEGGEKDKTPIPATVLSASSWNIGSSGCTGSWGAE